MKTFFHIALLWVLCLPFAALAQVNYQGVIITKNGIQLFQDAYDENAYYYLPKAPRLVSNQDSTYQTALVKYVNQQQGVNGAYFSAVLEYKLDQKEIIELERELKDINSAAHIKGQLPLYTFKEDARYGNTSFKLISSTFSAKNEMLNEVITSGHAPLQSGAKAAIMMELSQQGASLLEQSLWQETSDLNVLITAYYPALSPSFFAKISAPTQALIQIFKRDFKQRIIAPNEVEQFMQSQEVNQLLDIEIFDDKGDAQKTGKAMELIQLFTEQLIPRFFEPVLGNCTDQQSGTACLKLMKDPNTTSDSIQIVLQSKSIVKVPVIMAANIGGFIKGDADMAKYVKTIHHNKDFIGTMRKVVAKVDEQYLEAFDDCLKGVAVRIKTDTSARPVELSFNWSEIKNGQYKKEIALRFKNPNDTFYYQVGWQFAQVDTTIISPWVATSNPFITLVPPLEKRVIDLYHRGDENRGIIKIIVEFYGKIGQSEKDKLINKIALDPTGDFQTQSITLFTDIASPVEYRPRWYFNNQPRLKQKPQLLNRDSIIWLNPDNQ